MCMFGPFHNVRVMPMRNNWNFSFLEYTVSVHVVGVCFTDTFVCTSNSVVQDVMSLQRLQNLVQPVLEPLIRRVVSLWSFW